MNIRLNGRYRTRDGHGVTILRKSHLSQYEWEGVMDGCSVFMSWTKDGRYWSDPKDGENDPDDLVKEIANWEEALPELRQHLLFAVKGRVTGNSESDEVLADALMAVVKAFRKGYEQGLSTAANLP